VYEALAVTASSAGLSRIDLGQIIALDLFHNLPDSFLIGRVYLYALVVKHLDGPPSDSGADDGIDTVFRQLAHRMTGAVSMSRISILHSLDFPGLAVIKREIWSRAEMVAQRLVNSSFTVGRYAYQHCFLPFVQFDICEKIN
jgi:hypothetical protein